LKQLVQDWEPCGVTCASGPVIESPIASSTIESRLRLALTEPSVGW